MNKRNKIVFYGSDLYPFKTGGMEIYNYFLIKELAKSPDSTRITVLSSYTEMDGGSSNILPIKNNIFGIRRYGLGTFSNILYYCFSSKIRWKEVKIIYIPYTSNFSYNAFPFLILKKLLKVDYVIHIHGGGLRQWKPRWLLKSFFKNAHNIAGVSHPIVEEYTKRTGRKVQYLPPLLPFQQSAEDKKALLKGMGFSRFKKIILFVGSIKQLKSPETLLKAYVELGEDFISQHKIGLIIVGDGSLRSQMENIFTEFDSIIFEGAMPNEKIRDYYKIADIYAITSWYEGTPISLLEAMFNRLPCIGTNVSGIREIIEHGVNGYLFEKEDYAELSNIIRKITSDRKKSITLGENAYKYFSNNFNYDKHLTEIIKFMGE